MVEVFVDDCPVPEFLTITTASGTTMDVTNRTATNGISTKEKQPPIAMLIIL